MRVPSYRLHRPSGLAVVTLRGVAYYLGKYGSEESKARYRKLIAEYMATGLTPTNGKPLSVVEAVERFTAAVVRQSADPANESHYRNALAPLLQLFGGEPVASIGPLRFREIRAVYPALGWSVTHCNAQADRLRRFLRWLVTEEQFPAEKLVAIKALPRLTVREAAPGRGSYAPVSWDVVSATLEDCTWPIRGLVNFLWWTSARAGEAVQLSANLIRQDGVMELPDGESLTLAGVWIFRPVLHKTRAKGHERFILIGPRGQKMVHPYLRPGLAFSPRDVTSRAGESYGAVSLGRAVARAAERVGVSHWHPHQLRHAAATRFRAAGGLEVARILLGHAPATVTERYARPDWHRAAQVICEVG